MATESNNNLKRLGFVSSYAATADGLYRRVRAVVPKAVEPAVANVESLAAPVLTRAADAAEKVLHLADEQVDYVVTTADKTYVTGKKTVVNAATSALQMHEANVKTFSETSRAYYTWVQQFADWAKERLNPVKGGQAALDTLLAAMAKAKEASDPDVAAKMATDAWSAFAALPGVSRVLDTADPLTRTALSSFYNLHDSLVGMSVYKRVVDSGASTLTWATTTSPYKLGAAYLYPFVQPVADPALSKLAGSKVINDTLAYWKPTVTAA